MRPPNACVPLAAVNVESPVLLRIAFHTSFPFMLERIVSLGDLPAVLAFIFGAVVIVVSLGSLFLTLLAIAGIHI